MRRRAERHGGTFVLTTPAADGTRPFRKRSKHFPNGRGFLSRSTRRPFRGRLECGRKDAVGGAHRAEIACAATQRKQDTLAGSVANAGREGGGDDGEMREIT
jgi:hypothetical protein